MKLILDLGAQIALVFLLQEEEGGDHGVVQNTYGPASLVYTVSDNEVEIRNCLKSVL